MQDAIVTHLANAMDFQLLQAEGARLKRTPAANRDAEDLALQCFAAASKAGYTGKEADPEYALCEQALAIDPNNVRALTWLGIKFFALAQTGVSATERRPRAGRRIGIQSARPRCKLDCFSLRKGAILRLRRAISKAIAKRSAQPKPRVRRRFEVDLSGRERPLFAHCRRPPRYRRAAGLRKRAKPTSRSQSNAGFCPDSGLS